MTITHPYHPLRGQQVEIIRIHHRGADPDLIIQFPDGLHAAIAMSWTDYITPQGLDLPSDPLHLLDFNGLRQTVQLINRIRQKGHCSTADDRNKTCTSDDESYD